YAPAMLSLDYFPDRYKAHIRISLAINILTGVTLAEVASQNAAGPAEAGLSRSRRSVSMAVVALPSAVRWAPSLAGAAAHIGMDTTRLRVELACVLIAAILTGWAGRAPPPVSSPPRIFFVFPFVAIIGWMLCVRTGLDEGRFWPDPGGDFVAWWSIGVPATALFTVILTSVGRPGRPGGGTWSRERWMGLIPAAVLCYSALAAFRIAPAYVAPHYSMKQASRSLGLSLASSAGLVATSNAEGLFNDNALAYRTVVGWTWPTYRPDIMVIVFAFDDPEGLLSREYCLMESYRSISVPNTMGQQSCGSTGGRRTRPPRHSLARWNQDDESSTTKPVEIVGLDPKSVDDVVDPDRSILGPVGQQRRHRPTHCAPFSPFPGDPDA